MLLYHNNKYYKPPTDRFITYEDKDIGITLSEDKLVEAGRGDGRTTKDLDRLFQASQNPGMYIFLALSTQASFNLAEEYYETYKHIQPIIRDGWPKGILEIDTEQKTKLVFLSIHNNLRGYRPKEIIVDHAVIERSMNGESVQMQQILKRQLMMVKFHILRDCYDPSN